MDWVMVSGENPRPFAPTPTCTKFEDCLDEEEMLNEGSGWECACADATAQNLIDIFIYL